MKKEKTLRNCNNLCELCNKRLGYYEDKKTKKTFKREFYSISPFVFNNKKYFRKMCVDCFFEKYNRLPKSPNVPNNDFVILLGIDENIIRDHFKKRAVTEKNLIDKYGEKEGKKRFEEYKVKQSISNTFEYKNKKYGMTEEEFKEFNKSRATTEDNMILRYGEEEGKKRFKKYRNRQSYAGCKEEYFIEKYGEKEGKKKYIELNKKKKHSLETFILKYDEREGKKRFEEYMQNANSFYSKSSQALFWKIYEFLPEDVKEKTYFAENNNEFGIYDKLNKTYRKYDFVISNLNFCIEYNGDHYHANPKMYSIDECCYQEKRKTNNSSGNMEK